MDYIDGVCTNHTDEVVKQLDDALILVDEIDERKARSQ
jgi:hypothetical protein